MDRKILAPVGEVNKVKAEMALLRDTVRHLKTCVSDLRQAIEEQKLENNRISISTDSGMLSETVNNNRKYTLTLDDLAAAAIIRISNIQAGNETSEPEQRLIKPLKYGIIRHNPKKRQRIKEQTKELATEDLTQQNPIKQTKEVEVQELTVAQNPIVSPKRQALKPVNQSDPEWKTPTHIHKKKRANHSAKPIINGSSAELIPIGTGKTSVPRDIYSKINWQSYTIATRKLLVAVFPRNTLATHSLTGKASPAFSDKPAKQCLDQDKVNDIVITVSEMCKVKESLVRNAITTKCADENKMLRMQQKRKSDGSF